jgi:hypothetical protein
MQPKTGGHYLFRGFANYSINMQNKYGNMFVSNVKTWYYHYAADGIHHMVYTFHRLTAMQCLQAVMCRLRAKY